MDSFPRRGPPPGLNTPIGAGLPPPGASPSDPIIAHPSNAAWLNGDPTQFQGQGGLASVSQPLHTAADAQPQRPPTHVPPPSQRHPPPPRGHALYAPTRPSVPEQGNDQWHSGMPQPRYVEANNGATLRNQHVATDQGEGGGGELAGPSGEENFSRPYMSLDYDPEILEYERKVDACQRKVTEARQRLKSAMDPSSEERAANYLILCKAELRKTQCCLWSKRLLKERWFVSSADGNGSDVITGTELFRMFESKRIEPTTYLFAEDTRLPPRTAKDVRQDIFAALKDLEEKQKLAATARKAMIDLNAEDDMVLPRYGPPPFVVQPQRNTFDALTAGGSGQNSPHGMSGDWRGNNLFRQIPPPQPQQPHQHEMQHNQRRLTRQRKEQDHQHDKECKEEGERGVPQSKRGQDANGMAPSRGQHKQLGNNKHTRLPSEQQQQQQYPSRGEDALRSAPLQTLDTGLEPALHGDRHGMNGGGTPFADATLPHTGVLSSRVIALPDDGPDLGHLNVFPPSKPHVVAHAEAIEPRFPTAQGPTPPAGPPTVRSGSSLGEEYGEKKQQLGLCSVNALCCLSTGHYGNCMLESNVEAAPQAGEEQLAALERGGVTRNDAMLAHRSGTKAAHLATLDSEAHGQEDDQRQTRENEHQRQHVKQVPPRFQEDVPGARHVTSGGSPAGVDALQPSPPGRPLMSGDGQRAFSPPPPPSRRGNMEQHGTPDGTATDAGARGRGVADGAGDDAGTVGPASSVSTPQKPAATVPLPRGPVPPNSVLTTSQAVGVYGKIPNCSKPAEHTGTDTSSKTKPNAPTMSKKQPLIADAASPRMPPSTVPTTNVEPVYPGRAILGGQSMEGHQQQQLPQRPPSAVPVSDLPPPHNIRPPPATHMTPGDLHSVLAALMRQASAVQLPGVPDSAHLQRLAEELPPQPALSDTRPKFQWAKRKRRPGLGGAFKKDEFILQRPVGAGAESQPVVHVTGGKTAADVANAGLSTPRPHPLQQSDHLQPALTSQHPDKKHSRPLVAEQRDASDQLVASLNAVQGKNMQSQQTASGAVKLPQPVELEGNVNASTAGISALPASVDAAEAEVDADQADVLAALKSNGIIGCSSLLYSEDDQKAAEGTSKQHIKCPRRECTLFIDHSGSCQLPAPQAADHSHLTASNSALVRRKKECPINTTCTKDAGHVGRCRLRVITEISKRQKTADKDSGMALERHKLGGATQAVDAISPLHTRKSPPISSKPSQLHALASVVNEIHDVLLPNSSAQNGKAVAATLVEGVTAGVAGPVRVPASAAAASPLGRVLSRTKSHDVPQASVEVKRCTRTPYCTKPDGHRGRCPNTKIVNGKVIPVMTHCNAGTKRLRDEANLPSAAAAAAGGGGGVVSHLAPSEGRPKEGPEEHGAEKAETPGKPTETEAVAQKHDVSGDNAESQSLTDVAEQQEQPLGGPRNGSDDGDDDGDGGVSPKRRRGAPGREAPRHPPSRSGPSLTPALEVSLPAPPLASNVEPQTLVPCDKHGPGNCALQAGHKGNCTTNPPLPRELRPRSASRFSKEPPAAATLPLGGPRRRKRNSMVVGADPPFDDAITDSAAPPPSDMPGSQAAPPPPPPPPPPLCASSETNSPSSTSAESFSSESNSSDDERPLCKKKPTLVQPPKVDNVRGDKAIAKELGLAGERVRTRARNVETGKQEKLDDGGGAAGALGVSDGTSNEPQQGPTQSPKHAANVDHTGETEPTHQVPSNQIEEVQQQQQQQPSQQEDRETRQRQPPSPPSAPRGRGRGGRRAGGHVSRGRGRGRAGPLRLLPTSPAHRTSLGGGHSNGRTRASDVVLERAASLVGGAGYTIGSDDRRGSSRRQLHAGSAGAAPIAAASSARQNAVHSAEEGVSTHMQSPLPPLTGMELEEYREMCERGPQKGEEKSGGLLNVNNLMRKYRDHDNPDNIALTRGDYLVHHQMKPPDDFSNAIRNQPVMYPQLYYDYCMYVESKAQAKWGSTRCMPIVEMQGFRARWKAHVDLLEKQRWPPNARAPNHTSCEGVNNTSRNVARKTVATRSRRRAATVMTSSPHSAENEALLRKVYRALQDRQRAPYFLRNSKIHGHGLFARALIRKDAFVAVYEGEHVTKEESDEREKQYKAEKMADIGRSPAAGSSANLGSALLHAPPAGDCYMFSTRIDGETDADRPWVVDATRMEMAAARYINHSCDPNCVAKVLCERSGRRMICIFALRDINPGEELAYNYHIDPEQDESVEVPVCTCGARNCSGRLDVAPAEGSSLEPHQAA